MSKEYMVVQDGKPLRRGLSREEAERHAAYLAHGFESKRANDKRRVAEFEIKKDKGLIAELDANWKALKRGDYD
jgi:hypothetical protein